MYPVNLSIAYQAKGIPTVKKVKEMEAGIGFEPIAQAYEACELPAYSIPPQSQGPSDADYPMRFWPNLYL